MTQEPFDFEAARKERDARLAAAMKKKMPDFDGKTYNRGRDHARLGSQLQRVYECMCDGQWRTLEQIAAIVGAPEASVSARLRDLRKPKFGSHEVIDNNVRSGLWEYRLVVNVAAAQ